MPDNLKRIIPRVAIYTDGGAWPNPGPGGWGIYILNASSYPMEFHGGRLQTTNNEMEVCAIYKALSWLQANGSPPAAIYCDSQYALKSVFDWSNKWASGGWIKPYENRRIIQAAYQLRIKLDVKHHWVRGHSGIPANERADQLATQGKELAIAGFETDLYSVPGGGEPPAPPPESGATQPDFLNMGPAFVKN